MSHEPIPSRRPRSGFLFLRPRINRTYHIYGCRPNGRCTWSTSSRSSSDGGVLEWRHPDLYGMTLYSIGVISIFARRHCTWSTSSQSSWDDTILKCRHPDLHGTALYWVGSRRRCTWSCTWSTPSNLCGTTLTRGHGPLC